MTNLGEDGVLIDGAVLHTTLAVPDDDLLLLESRVQQIPVIRNRLHT